MFGGLWGLGREGAAAEGGARRFPPLPLLLVILSLGLLLLFPLFLLLRIETLSREVDDVLRPARNAVSAIQFELGLQAAASRAFVLSGDPTYLRQLRESRMRREEAVERLMRLSSKLDPTIQEAFTQLEEGLAENDRFVDMISRGGISPGEFRILLPDQHRRLLASLERASGLERRLDEEIAGRRARHDRANLMGLLVEVPLLLLVLVAAFQVYRLGKQFQAVALEFERIAGQQRQLHQVSSSLVESLSVREMMEVVIRGAVRTAQARAAFVEQVVDGERKWVEVVASEGEGGPPLGTRVAYPGSLTEGVMERGQPEILGDLGELGESMAAILSESCKGCSGLVVPLIAEAKPLGALVLLRTKDQPAFTPEEAKQVQALGNLASAAIQPALLHEALAESEERFRQVADHVDQVIWLASPDLRRRYYTNPAYEKVWERSLESAYADPMSPNRAIHPDDYGGTMEKIRKVRYGQPYDTRYRVIRPDGSVRWVRSRGYPVRNVRGEVYRIAGITEDITETIRAEEEREELLRRERDARAEADKRRIELEQLTKSRERLIRGLGHDLKNPISAADGYLQLLEHQAKAHLPPKRQLHIERARRALHRALDLLENLLDFARAEAGNLEIKFEEVHIGTIAEQVAEEYRAQAEANGLELGVHMPEEIPTIASDGRRIAQILGNLLSNAMKYTDEGSVTVEVKVEEERVGVLVRDTGRGISPEDQARIFQEYFRASKEEEGAGIGLAISRLLARILDGDLTVESTPGEGSTFTLWLPRKGGANA